jgi:DNA-binding PadR family transcriptional regulator
MSYMANQFGIWEIAVLALLREAPMHPYQMQRLLHLRHKDELLALKRGSLYHAIRRLSRDGLIEVEKTAREGNRPERTSYRLTPTGLKAFLDVLRKILATPRREPSECMAAMSFLVHLDPEEAGHFLDERDKKLSREIAQLAAGIAAASERVERINLIESEYLLAMLRAERAWVRKLGRDIREGTLVWNLKTVLREAATSRNAARRARRPNHE